MVTIPTGSIVGIAILALIVGIVVGRSGRAMGQLGRLHAAAHGGGGGAGGNARTGDQSVSQVVVVAGDGAGTSRDVVERTGAVVEGRTVPGVAGSPGRGVLVEANTHELTGWGDYHEVLDAEVLS